MTISFRIAMHSLFQMKAVQSPVRQLSSKLGCLPGIQQLATYSSGFNSPNTVGISSATVG
jgi:hypothetical protein